MKHSTSTTTNGKKVARQSRDREFLDMYDKALASVLKQNISNPKRVAVRWTIYNSCPHYHVSFDRAYKVVSHLLRKGYAPLMPSLQASMWMEIAQRVRSLINDAGMSIAKAIDFVLTNCRASRFFISEHYAYTTLVDRARHERMKAKYGF